KRGAGPGDAPCLPSGASCWHKYAYDWDEVGRLVDARRWDVERGGVPAVSEDVHLTYAYDASDQRVLKTAVSGTNELHTVYVFGSVELRRAHYELAGAEAALDYERSAATEAPYLSASGVRLGRVAFENAIPNVSVGKVHVLLELGDHLGSTTSVLDKATSELVEASTYEAYGGAESDYRPERWGQYREDYRFTGKEEDAEVGLAYFGRR